MPLGIHFEKASVQDKLNGKEGAGSCQLNENACFFIRQAVK
jgi:hypothetical protein